MTSLVDAAMRAQAERLVGAPAARATVCSECQAPLPKYRGVGRPLMTCGAPCRAARLKRMRDGWRKPAGWVSWEQIERAVHAAARKVATRLLAEYARRGPA